MFNLQKYFLTQTTKNISSILKDEKITLVDIGAAGGIQSRWQPIAKCLDYIGFEPDSRSDTYSDSASGVFASEKIYPIALWSTTQKIKVHLCKKPEVSSCYEPNMEILQRYPNAKRFDVMQRVELDARSLDDLNLVSADFIKIDIQGAELDALQGAVSTLRSVFGIELEVEFLNLYKGQPLFGDLNAFLTMQGFEFVDFTNLCRWGRSKRNTYGQCVFGDALFLKSPELILDMFGNGKVSLGDVRRYISILVLYRRVDLILRCLELLNENEETKVFKKEVELVCSRLSKKLKKWQLIKKIAGTLLGESKVKLHLFY